MTIAGAVYVASVFFVVAWIYGAKVCNLEVFARHLEPYKTYVGVAAVALSYIFGFVAHRFIQIASWPWRWLAQRKPCKQINGILNRLAGAKELTDRMHEEMVIWETSPQRIHHEIDFQFAQVALLRSLAVSVPCLVFSIRAWRLSAGLLAWPPVYWTCILVFYGLLILAFWRQSFQYDRIRDEAFIVGKRYVGHLVPSLSPVSGPVKTAVTIKGINFGETKGSVTFDGRPVPPLGIIWEPTRIVVLVPEEVGGSDDTLDRAVLITVDCTVPDTNTGESFTLRLTCPHFTVTKKSPPTQAPPAKARASDPAPPAPPPTEAH